jgi:hypothetical protein
MMPALWRRYKEKWKNHTAAWEADGSEFDANLMANFYPVYILLPLCTLKTPAT